MFSKLINKLSLSGRDLLLLIAGCLWVTFNVYFLPFAVWTAGIIRPWFMLNGLLPYRDFTWIRNPLDLFLLSFWYKVLGANQQSYQLFVYFLLLLITVTIFFILKSLLPKAYKLTFIFYFLFAFFLFGNTEEGEVLLCLLNLLAAALMIIYLRRHALKWLSLTGFLGGLIYILKQNSVFVVVSLFLVLLFDVFLRRKVDQKFFVKLIVFISGVIISIGVLLGYFLYKGALGDYFYYTVTFIFNIYGPYGSNLTHGDGLWIAASFLSILFPFVIFYKKNGINSQHSFLLSVLLVASLFALLPSFLSYRAFPAFGLLVIIAGYNLEVLFNNQLRKSKLQKLMIGASFILFFVFSFNFTNSYFSFVNENGIAFGRYITDYGDNEYQIAQWIRSNTKQQERIIDYGSEMIYLLSNRLPKHKYIEPFPTILTPYDKTSSLFIKDPPGIVVYDTSLVDVHKGLSTWPFIKFMQNNYRQVGKYGETLVIYQYYPNQLR